MKHVLFRVLQPALFLLPYCLNALPADSVSIWLNPWLSEVSCGMKEMEQEFYFQSTIISARLSQLRTELRSKSDQTADKGFALLLEKDLLEDDLRALEAQYELKKLKFRYRKGIELVKMLYEKILSMDHHFNSLKAQQDLLKLSNPHNYPEFKEAGKLMEERLKRKYDFTMPAVLQSNPYLSSAFSILGMVLAGNSTESSNKKAEWEKISCIMDFTVRMHSDLGIIYYENGYLRDANATLKKDCEALFSDCARQVGYNIPLENCRENDDWERLYALLDNLVAKATDEQAGTDERLSARTETNLRFAVERVTLFVSRYTDFVNQGNEYYKKFGKIVAGYENETQCSAILPDQFRQLRSDIEQTLDKFNNAYRMPEVQGSKLKDMLYGTGEN